MSTTTDTSRPDHTRKMSMSYGRFAAMIATSTVVMLGLMYLNTFQLSHVRWSETRAWMALLMGAVMAIIMLVFIWRSYDSRAVNVMIIAGSLVVFVGALFLVRSQTTITDNDFMRAMIPHHSIAILTSGRAGIEDQRVRELADEIIAAQEREIAGMEWLIADIINNGVAATDQQAAQRPVPDFGP